MTIAQILLALWFTWDYVRAVRMYRYGTTLAAHIGTGRSRGLWYAFDTTITICLTLAVISGY